MGCESDLKKGFLGIPWLLALFCLLKATSMVFSDLFLCCDPPRTLVMTLSPPEKPQIISPPQDL
jgi:hypothetical protein